MIIALALLGAGLGAVVGWALLSSRSLSKQIDQRLKAENALQLRMTERAVKAAESQRENQCKADEVRKDNPEGPTQFTMADFPSSAWLEDWVTRQYSPTAILARDLFMENIRQDLTVAGIFPHSPHLERAHMMRLVRALRDVQPAYTVPTKPMTVGIPTKAK